MLDIKIDVDAELARIGKEITKRDGEIASAKARLGNPSFADRAPAAVVEQVRKQLADSNAKLAELRLQLERLK